ncbi:MAG: hypothetical protein RL757_2668 [Bacteroidota bacterium]|jgi:hypothetical protein
MPPQYKTRFGAWILGGHIFSYENNLLFILEPKTYIKAQ